MRVLVDADVVLELFINRSGFVEDAEKLLIEIGQSQQIEVYVTDKCLKRIRLELSATDDQLGELAAYKVKAMLNSRIIKIDSNIREQARKSSIKDFDSAEEVACATILNFDAIVTQNPQNFDEAILPIWSVNQLIQYQIECQNQINSKNREWAIAEKMPLPQFRFLHISYQKKEKMVQSNLCLVFSVAIQYINRGLPLEDLIEEGRIGLIRAAEKFDSEKGYKFSTYAKWYIRQAIIRVLAD